MPTVKWEPLTVFERRAEEINIPWIPVIDAMRDYTHLCIRGEGQWSQGAESSVPAVPMV